MNHDHFKLVGHDNPLGRYPAPVVPICRFNRSLVAVYATDLGAETVPLNGRVKFVRYNKLLKETLKEFYYRSHRLFAISESNVEYYPIRSEERYLESLLQRPSLRQESPFFRLSLAKGTKQPELIVREMISCLEELRQGPQGFVNLWYTTQREELYREIKLRPFLPGDWHLLLLTARLTDYRSAKRRAETFGGLLTDIYKGTPWQHRPVHVRRMVRQKPGTAQGRMTKSEIINHLAEKFGLSRSLVQDFFAELAKLAAREIRVNGEFSLPGIGTLVLSQRRSHEGRKPTTSGIIKLHAERTLKHSTREKVKNSVTARGRFK